MGDDMGDDAPWPCISDWCAVFIDEGGRRRRLE